MSFICFLDRFRQSKRTFFRSQEEGTILFWKGTEPVFRIYHHNWWNDHHLTSMNGAYYLSLLQNTVWSKLWFAATRYFQDSKIALQPIVQMQISHFSMRSFEAESSKTEIPLGQNFKVSFQMLRLENDLFPVSAFACDMPRQATWNK